MIVYKKKKKNDCITNEIRKKNMIGKNKQINEVNLSTFEYHLYYK